MKAILTGFEPFGDYKHNPTQDLAIAYDGRTIFDIEVTGLVLPAAYHEAFDILYEKINEIKPDIILSTGLASRIKKLRLELVGFNCMDGKYPDAKGRYPKGKPIIPGCRDYYHVNRLSNSVSLADVLNDAGLRTELSVNAGGFVCESLLYLTSGYIYETHQGIRNAFLHIPWTKDYLGIEKIGTNKRTLKKSDLHKAIDLSLIELRK